ALVTPKSASGAGLGRAMGKVRRPRHAPGRWSLLYTEGADRDRSVESCCWMLLRRYGVVFRDLLVRETNLPRWRELQIGYRRLEDRGEVRGGRSAEPGWNHRSGRAHSRDLGKKRHLSRRRIGRGRCAAGFWLLGFCLLAFG